MVKDKEDTQTEDTASNASSSSASLPISSPTKRITTAKLPSSSDEENLRNKYKYLSEFAILQTVDPNGHKLSFLCRKCKPKKIHIKCTRLSLYNLSRHMQARHFGKTWQEFNEVYLSKGKHFGSGNEQAEKKEASEDESETEGKEEPESLNKMMQISSPSYKPMSQSISSPYYKPMSHEGTGDPYHKLCR